MRGRSERRAPAPFPARGAAGLGLVARVYDLRHGCASLLLSIGVSPTEVARRLGHSVQMLFTVYAHWLSDEIDHANKIIEAAVTVLPGTREHPGQRHRGEDVHRSEIRAGQCR